MERVHGWKEFIKTPEVKAYLDDTLKAGFLVKNYKIEKIVHEEVQDLLHTCMSLLIKDADIMMDLEKPAGCPEWKWLLMHIDYRIAKKNAKVFPVMLLDNPETSKKEDPKTSNNKMDRRVADIKRETLNLKELLDELNARDSSH